MNPTSTLPRNVAAWLPHMAAHRPERLAIAAARSPGSFDEWTCAELDRRCDKTAHALLAAGITPGMRTAVMVAPGPAFFAITFALLKIGAVPVLLDPGMGIDSLGRCLLDAAPAAFVGIPKAHVARILFGWARRSLRIRIAVGARVAPGTQSLERLERAAPDAPFPTYPPRPDETAAILFTSGSTGLPKGVVYSHGNFVAQIDLLRSVYGISPGEIELATFPLFGLFGPALGMACIVPWMDASRPTTADPRDLIAAIERYQCTSMFASPALVDLLGRHCAATGARLPGLRRVISAGAPARPDALARLVAALAPGTPIHTPYGATEALPVTTIDSRTILDETAAKTRAGGGVCVGSPVPGMQVAILEIRDAPIASFDPQLLSPPGAIGEIVVRGPVVTPGYFDRPAETAAARIRDGEQEWHRMGDVGYLDPAGRLWMCGRKSHRVRTDAGRTLFTIPCEAIFDAHPAVRRSALVGVAGRPALCVELRPEAVQKAGADSSRAGDREPLGTLAREILALGRPHAHAAGIEQLLFHPRFPVDVRHNAKIFREKLATWAAARL